mmetsp:Transcript_19606/g.39974  ORF Transcript_19606/g.39974 Transcript_19606/m.39974 type:complete len:271 (+) Transcript_19606:1202-2014(+)
MRMPLDAPTNMSRARNTPAERKSRWATCSTNAPRNLRLFVLFALPVRFRKTRHGSRWALAPAPSLRRPVPRSTPTRQDVPQNSSRALPTQEATRSLSEPSSTNVPPLRPPIAPLRSRRIGRRRRLDRGRPLHRHRRPHLLSHVRSGYPGVPRRVRRRHCLRGRRQGRLRELRLRMHRDLRRALSPSFAESRGGRGGVVRARCLHGIHGPHFLSHLRCQCAGMSRRVRRRHGLRGRGQGLRRKYRLFVPGRLRHHLPTIRPRRLRRIPRVD